MKMSIGAQHPAAHPAADNRLAILGVGISLVFLLGAFIVPETLGRLEGGPAPGKA
jgi:hypothetical protein